MREKISRYNLVTGEDTFASQTAQDPRTSRRVFAMVPSIAGDLVRELPQPTIGGVLPGSIEQIVQFDWNNGSGGITRYLFATTVDPAAPGWVLYVMQSPWTTWVPVEVDFSGGITGPTRFIMGNNPMFRVINNCLQFSDGFNNFIFDPKMTTTPPTQPIVLAGFFVPSDESVWTPEIDTTPVGVLNVVTNRYYWVTFADHTVNHVHESDSGPISAGTGALVNKKVRVYQQKGTIDLNSVVGNPLRVVGHSTTWDNTLENNLLRADNGVGGVYTARIATVIDATHLDLDPASATPPVVVGTHNFTILPNRATHWHIYASESENSKVGYLLREVPKDTFYYDDETPFLGGTPPATDGNVFTGINRPFRNDPPVPSLILEFHKFRLWRRREARPNFFNFTAMEEVLSGENGSPYESVPGTDARTLSDIVNEDPLPDQSTSIRAMTSHGDALWIGSERNKIPLFGETIDDFAFSQVTALSVGDHGRFASISTPHGMAFVSYDKKAYLYPTSMMPFAYTPKDVNVTENLIEIGRPIRKSLEKMGSDISNARLLFYNYGRRNWLVLCFREKDSPNTPHTWIYDFETKSWFESQRGFVSVAIFEPTTGNKILVGGGLDGGSGGQMYVIDDLTGTYPTDPAANGPASLWRPALIDFGDPDNNHMPLYLEYELSDAALADDITVNFYLDPVDADNPGTPQTLNMMPVEIGANKFRGMFTENTEGVICQRLLVEFNLAAGLNRGSISGIKLIAEKVEGLLT